MELNDDVQRTVYRYLPYSDVRSVECASRVMGVPASERRQDAALKITRFIRYASSHVRMMVFFMRRCIYDEQWRERYIYVHQVPRPHVCFRVWPAWLLQSPLKQHLMEIALSHVDVEIAMHGWAMDHGAELFR